MYTIGNTCGPTKDPITEKVFCTIKLSWEQFVYLFAPTKVHMTHITKVKCVV